MMYVCRDAHGGLSSRLPVQKRAALRAACTAAVLTSGSISLAAARERAETEMLTMGDSWNCRVVGVVGVGGGPTLGPSLGGVARPAG